MEKLQTFGRSMIAKSSIKATALSFFLVVAFLFSSLTSYADFRPDVSFDVLPADTSGLDMAAGAVIDAALGGLGVDIGLGAGATLTTYNLIDSVIHGTPLGVAGYEYNGSFYSLVDQSTIRIRDDVITIDGVDYKDVWLPHDAAAKFRVNAFDFISFYNIVSESSGVYASGVGSIGSYPVYHVGSDYVTQTVQVPLVAGTYSIPGGTCTVLGRESYYPSRDFTFLDGVTQTGSLGSRFWPYSVRGQIGFTANSVTIRGHSNDGTTSFATIHEMPLSYYDNTPFDFTWVSSSIPADPLPVEQGLRIRVPSSYVVGIPSTLDPSLPNYSDLLHSLSSAIEQARLANVVQSTAFEEFDVPSPPVPSTGTIAEEPYSSLDGSLGNIQDSLDNIDINIGTVDQSLDDIQIYAQDAADSLQSIDTNLSQSVSDTSGIKGFIQQYLPGVHSFLSSISTSVSNIAGSVAAADETFFGNVVDSILAPFTPVFNVFRSGIGIWHYVVSWVGTISAPFTWSLSALGSAGSYFLSPIYACAAAAVVLAVYKRFGR